MIGKMFYWLLGILIYEMMVGYPPFFEDTAVKTYEKILAGKIEWPRFVDPVGKDLIKKLLVSANKLTTDCNVLC